MERLQHAKLLKDFKDFDARAKKVRRLNVFCRETIIFRNTRNIYEVLAPSLPKVLPLI